MKIVCLFAVSVSIAAHKEPRRPGRVGQVKTERWKVKKEKERVKDAEGEEWKDKEHRKDRPWHADFAGKSKNINTKLTDERNVDGKMRNERGRNDRRGGVGCMRVRERRRRTGEREREMQ